MIKRDKGFTLIELLVVIAIIGILSAIVLASLNSAREKSRDARRISDLKQVQLALELYWDSHTNYPTSLEGIAKLADPAEGFLPAVPLDPLNVSPQVYVYGSEAVAAPQDYRLGVTLEDPDHNALDTSVGTDDFTISCDAAGEYCIAP